MSRRFRAESSNAGSRLLGRMLPDMASGDELVLVGRFGSFVLPAGVNLDAEKAEIERIQVTDGSVFGGVVGRLYTSGRVRVSGLRAAVLHQTGGELWVDRCAIGAGDLGGRAHVSRSTGAWEITGEADLDDVKGAVKVTGTVRGTTLTGVLESAGRVQLERLTGRLLATAGVVEIAEVQLHGGGEPAVRVTGGDVFLDAGSIDGPVEHPGGTLRLGAKVAR